MAFDSYEDVEARAVESAKAAVKEARRKIEAYDRLQAAARAVVMAAVGPRLNHGEETTWHYEIAEPLFDALRAAVEGETQ